MVDLSTVEKADVLRGLTKADLIELGEIASEQEFEPRDCLFRRGDEGKNFYIATRGRFALTVDTRVFDGSVEMAVEDKGALDAFGWSSLVEPRTSIYSGYCTEAGAVVAFPRKSLEALMMTNRRLGEELLHNLNELIGTRVRVMQKLWLDEVSQSLARVQHWSHTELTTQWAAVMTEPGSRPVRRWIRRHSHLGTAGS
jgi:CRP-like cAMP-binding protein